jgi:hypothetical protein
MPTSSVICASFDVPFKTAWTVSGCIDSSTWDSDDWSMIQVPNSSPRHICIQPYGAIKALLFVPLSPFRFAMDLTMPPLWDIRGAFPKPTRRPGRRLFTVLAEAALITIREAVVGFAIGTLLGLL